MNLLTDFQSSAEARCIPDGQDPSGGADPKALLCPVRTEDPTARGGETQGRDRCENPYLAQVGLLDAARIAQNTHPDYYHARSGDRRRTLVDA
jgi:hypothetical protein